MGKSKRTMPRALAASKGPQEGKRGGRRSLRSLLVRLGVAGLLVAAAALGALAVAGGGSGPPSAQAQTDQEVGTLLSGIPQEGNALGYRDAPVTLQVFGDLECLDAKHWFVFLLPAIIEDFVRSGKIRLEYRSFKTDTHIAREFVQQQTAALAAGVQDKMWNFALTFYHEQGIEYTPYATESYIDGIASQVPGLNIARWHRDRAPLWRSEVVVADDKAARAFGFHDTPSFRIGRTGGPLKNFTGTEIIKYIHEKNPVSLVRVQDLEKAVGELTR